MPLARRRAHDHEVTRPVACLTSLSTYAALTARAAELRREGLGYAKIAAVLNAEGWRPAKRRDSFNAQMARRLLLGSEAEMLEHRRRPRQIERLPHEWTIWNSPKNSECGSPPSTAGCRTDVYPAAA